MQRLNADEILELCRKHPGWELADGELVRTFAFADFVEAMVFVNRVGILAEEAGHHPDLDIRYNKVRLVLVTHDVGGISTRDSDFVAKVAEW